MSSLYLQPLVVDLGRSSLQSGLAGSPSPQTSPSLVGTLKHPRVMAGGNIPTDETIGNWHTGKTVGSHPGAFVLEKAVDIGGKVDVEKYAALLQHTHQLNSCTIGSHPVMLTENTTAANLMRTRTELSQILFEEYQVPALFFSSTAVLSLYSAGVTTGSVITLGDSLMECCNVYQGLGLPHSTSGNSVAGGRVTGEMLKTIKSETGLSLTTSAEYEIAQKWKEDCCSLSASGAKEYKLPDGTAVSLNKASLSQPLECLFDPMLLGLEEQGCHKVVKEAIQKCDIDIREEMWGNLYLMGGTGGAGGVGERILKELRALSSPHTRIRITKPNARVDGVWVGGSILASLSAFKGMWVDREEWTEKGEESVRRRMLI
ncbi:hypothetical protein TL16_g10768 [Triparma laevis f. inornata]|uniref:Uncharacterized protein n=1 Tax=Triparma laevis f. inornata TaxID=1714386 RepID=A0A9W7EQK6_9STRA|nr:hypothetical protein TL16_g10768 [Triparma laevis f. inornata]